MKFNTRKQPNLRRLLWAAALGLLLGGCLEPSTGATTGGIESDAAHRDVAADSANDTAVDGGQDSSVDITLPWCAIADFCSDGNECTTDGCDEASQGCLFVQVPDGTACGDCSYCNAGQCLANINSPAEPSECSVDSDCDDGDPCTTASCECELAESPGSCGGADTGPWCWCMQSQTPNAPGCNPEPPTGFECNNVGAIDVEDALNLPAGTAVKVGGPAGIAPTAICSDNDDECGDCWGGVGMSGANGTLVMEPGVAQTFPQSWGCTTSFCEPYYSCGPLVADVAYWAWGTVGEDAPAGGGPAPIVRTLAVEGWCLQSPAPTFAGVYNGTIQPNVGGGIFAVTMTLALAHDGTWQVSLSAFASAPAQVGYNVEVSEGKLVFDAFVPDQYTGWSRFTLHSHENTLAGEYKDSPIPVDAAAGFPVPPFGGTVSFTRENY